MTYLLAKDRAIVSRNRALVVGSCPACCAPAPGCDYYYAFQACQSTTPPSDPCALTIAPTQTIYVGATLRCESSGVRLCDMPSLPAILWGGWCWLATLVPPAWCDSPLFKPGPNPEPFCPLPCSAIGPAGPTVKCVPASPSLCESHPCDGAARYVPLIPCPGFSWPGPPLYVCARDLEASFAAGIRCPAGQVGQVCFWADWPNTATSVSANAQRVSVSGTLADGCCACGGTGSCVSALAQQCPGQTNQYPTRCCAHAINGEATIVWRHNRRVVGPAGGFYDNRFGTARRANGVVMGESSRDSTFEQATIPYSFPNTGPFSPGTTAGTPPYSGLFLCGLPAPSSCPGTSTNFLSSGNCYYFVSSSSWSCADHLGNTETQSSYVVYVCHANPGDCDGGCATQTGPGGPIQLPDPGGQSANIPCLTGLGADGPPDYGPMYEALGG